MPYLIAFVPQLTMVDYKAIPSGEREVATAKYKYIVLKNKCTKIVTEVLTKFTLFCDFRAQSERMSTTDDKLIRRASVVEADENVSSLQTG